MGLELSWKSVLFGAIGFVGLQIMDNIAKFCWMKGNLSNNSSDSKVATQKKEEARYLRAILNAQTFDQLSNNSLFIEKALFGHFGNREHWNLEDLAWEVEGDTLQVVEDITTFIRLYNQGDRIDIPGDKIGLIGLDHLLQSTVAHPQLFIAYRKASDDPRQVTCQVFELDQPIHIKA